MNQKVLAVSRETDWSTENCKNTLAGPKLSEFRALDDTLERLVGIVDTLKRKVEEIIQRNDNFNVVHHEKVKESQVKDLYQWMI